MTVGAETGRPVLGVPVNGAASWSTPHSAAASNGWSFNRRAVVRMAEGRMGSRRECVRPEFRLLRLGAQTVKPNQCGKGGRE